MASPNPLTENAVVQMLTNERQPKPMPKLIVGLANIQSTSGEAFFQCKLFDGLNSTKALVRLSSDMEWMKAHQPALKIAVKGYTTSEANYCGTTATNVPFLCIDKFSVIESIPARKMGRSPALKQQNIQAGKVAAFLSEYSRRLSNTALAGAQACTGGTVLNRKRIHEIHEFMAQHAAMLILQSSGLAAQNHMSALNEFATSQLDRQKASLQSNAGREDAARSNQVEEQYTSTLNMALEHAETNEDLTVDLLKEWHSTLVGNGLCGEAGSLRKTNVRAGMSTFTPKERVEIDLNKLLVALKHLEARLVRQTLFEDNSRGLGALTFAAIVFFGIIDVHPFVDGNGRLSRVALSWALRRGGLPFVVNLFATQMQREDYVGAIRAVRRNTYLQYHGSSTISKQKEAALLLSAFRNAGGMLPLVDLLADRISRATTGFKTLVAEKLSLANEEAGAKWARRYREEAAAGTCLICFDDNPNIATLCCGKAVHLNCIATWLGERNSCPQCRAELPTLPRTVRGIQEDESSDDDASSVGSLTNAEYPGQRGAIGLHFDDVRHEVFAGENTISAGDMVQHHPCNRGSCQNILATDCINGWCGRCCFLYTAIICPRHFQDLMSEYQSTPPDDTTEIVEAAPRPAQFEDDTTATEVILSRSNQFQDDTETVEPLPRPTPFRGDTTVAGVASRIDQHIDDTTETEVLISRAAVQQIALDATTSDTTVVNANGVPTVATYRRILCSNRLCRSRAATDCSNGCCGRCCVLHGTHFCERHHRYS